MVTIRTIAAKAGVSTSTASRALNDNPRISQQTRQHVKQIARELGYRPNFSARNLSRGEANIIGVVFPIPDAKTTQPANPFHIEIMWGIGKAIRRKNYEMMVAMGTDQADLVRQVEAMAQQAKVHKFVLLYSQEDDPVVEYLRQHDLSYVIVGHPYNSADRFVDNDNVAVGKAATERLCSLHQLHHPAFVQSVTNHSFEADRRSGYEQAMQEQSLSAVVVRLRPQDDLMAWLANHSDVDGLVFADDVIYLRYARQLKESELPITCFNNSQWIKVVFSDQDVIDLQPQKLGAEAVKLLFKPRQQHAYVPYQVH